MFEDYIIINKKNIINSVCELITYPSISIESNNPVHPFGKNCSDCLRYFLDLANKLGFRTKNLDNYCGYAEYGDGDEIVGIIGHLDVVPANDDDWDYSPFIPSIIDNCIVGRGAIDDKGPVVAALYAMKAVMDYCIENNININKKVRLIVGLNEEKDWKCIEYYKAHEEIPSIGFSPDADFPCIYAEKGVLSLSISDKISDNEKIKITEVDTNNNALNVVPEFTSVTLSVDKKLNIEKVINSLKDIIKKYNYEIDIYKIDDESLKITSYGVSSHSAHPELGKNAISKLLIVLNDLFKNFNINCPLIKDYARLIGDDYSGRNLEIALNDESGNLTLNTSQLYIDNNKLFIAMNLRIPVKTDINDIINTFKEKFNSYSIEIISIKEPLYYEKENNLVTTLCDIFNRICNSNYEPIAIGGATYARAFDNCVSFGMNFPGDEDMCHKVNEFIQIDKLILSANIYAEAVYKLLQ